MVHEEAGRVVGRDVAHVGDVDLAGDVVPQRLLQVDHQLARVALDLGDLHRSRSFRLLAVATRRCVRVISREGWVRSMHRRIDSRAVVGYDDVVEPSDLDVRVGYLKVRVYVEAYLVGAFGPGDVDADATFELGFLDDRLDLEDVALGSQVVAETYRFELVLLVQVDAARVSLL